MIMRVADTHWHALEDDQVVGRGEAWRRPDGRTFLSIDSWHDEVFDQLAHEILTNLPTPIYTVVDEADRDLTSRWRRAGFVTRRREWEFVVPTDPAITGLGSTLPPPGVSIVPVGKADEVLLRQLDRMIRTEVEDWHAMPAEVLPRTFVDASKYAAAAQGHEYVGLIRLAMITRQPRLGLVAVRAEHQRRGIARTLLSHVLNPLHRNGIDTALAEVDETNSPALALFETIGAKRANSNLELIRE